jgi:hypothetical protein
VMVSFIFLNLQNIVLILLKMLSMKAIS